MNLAVKYNFFLLNFIQLKPEDTSIPDTPEGEIPKCDSTYSIDIPQSLSIWEADPRPANTSEVIFRTKKKCFKYFKYNV